MATFTIELFKVVDITGGNIGLDSYPIWKNEYREPLNQKIIDHYHNREIGVETIDMFTFALRRRMSEVMPYYNELYKTTELEFDPLSTVDLHSISSSASETETEGESESESTTKSSGNSRAVNSTMPQVQLSGRGDYATSAADTNSQNDGEGTGKDTQASQSRDSSDSESHTTGYQGVASDLLMRYRDTLLNIDLMVINELTDLFMMVWGNSDDYSPYPFTRLDAI